MKILTVFNNKGGVGKTTLTYHLSCALSELGKKVLMIDLDPQSNLTLYGCSIEVLHNIWSKEDIFIDEGFNAGKDTVSEEGLKEILSSTRTIHFLLKPTEDGFDDLSELPPPLHLYDNLDLIPGRLTLHQYEDKISSRWNDAYSGDVLAIRTITQIRNIAHKYAEKYGYEYVIIDTSPSLGTLNKVIISTADGFMIPALPDMFSLYGIRNIGNSLRNWKKNLDTIYSLISSEKRKSFPEKSIQFLGYTIYNAKRYSGGNMNLALAHYNYVKQIPDTIKEFIPSDLYTNIPSETISEIIGHESIMHAHNTVSSMSQKYRCPFWKVPSADLDAEDRGTIIGNKAIYENTQQAYIAFAQSFLERVDAI